MIKHLFVSTADDDGNPDHVQGTHWNQDHEIDDPDALTATLSPFSTTQQGLVSASSNAARYLRGDNTWSDATVLTAFLNTFTSLLKGLAPASGGGTTNFLRADGSWAAPPATSLFSTSVSGTVPASGSNNTYLKGDGTWSDATTLTAFLNAFTSALKGLVPPSGGGTTNFLRADGSWAAPSTPSTFSTSVSGIVPASGSGSTYLKGDGTWSDATTLTAFLNAFTSSLKGLVPASGGGTVNYLRADGQFVPSIPSSAGDPNPLTITATKGSLLRDTTNGNLFINVDGATTWAKLARTDVISVKNLGDGSDGSAIFDGVSAVTGFTGPVSSVYTATREVAFTTGTFSNGVVLDMTAGGSHAGFRIFFNSIVTVTSGTATIKYNGNAAVGTTGGTALGNNPQGNNSAAGAGGIQNAGQAGSNANNWTNRIKGGTGGAGGSSPTNTAGPGGTVGNTFSASIGEILTWEQALLSRINLSNSGIISGGAGGGSGAGTVGIASGGAGGGGAGVGVVGIGVMGTTGTLVIEARGGAGANGGTGGGSNAAGGGGGGGGVLLVGFGGSSQPSNLTIQCPGGAGGSPQGTGNAGSTGGTGSVRFYPLGPG